MDMTDESHGEYKEAKYRCNMLGSNKYVYDDCSKFVNAVFYNYLNKRYGDTFGFSLQYGSSEYKKNKKAYNILTDKNNGFGFELFTYDRIVKNNELAQVDNAYTYFKLREGDLLYHEEFYINDYGEKLNYAHLEFCIEDGGGKSFGWGMVHDDFYNNKYSKVFEFNNQKNWVRFKNNKNNIELEQNDVGQGGYFNIANYNDEKLYKDKGVPYLTVIRLVQDEDNYYNGE